MLVAHGLKGNRPDWEHIPSDDWSKWQRLAAYTHGYATPANLVTLLGLCLSLLGLGIIYNGSFLLGILALGLGRLADIFDGYIAALTGTKCPVGESLDAGTDKIIAIVGCIVLVVIGYVPPIPLFIILAQNICNVIFGAIASLRKRELHPSIAGKRATLLQWLVILMFIIARAATPRDVFIADTSTVLAYVGFVPFLVLGLDATIGYARHASGYGPSKPYVDDEGAIHRYVVRLVLAYWHKKWLVDGDTITGEDDRAR